MTPHIDCTCVADEPKLELSASTDTGQQSIEALLAFARACLQHAA